jgi:hypothetical protein
MYPDVIARDDNGKVVRKLGHEFYAKHSVRAAPRRAAQSIRRQPLVARLLRPRSAGDAGWHGRCWPARPSPGGTCRGQTADARDRPRPRPRPLARARAFARASASARVQAVATANPMAKASTGLIKLRDQVQSIACLQGPSVPRAARNEREQLGGAVDEYYRVPDAVVERRQSLSETDERRVCEGGRRRVFARRTVSTHTGYCGVL